MRTLLIGIVCLLASTTALAQTIQPGQKASLGASNAVAIIGTINDTTLTVQVQATWTGTLSFEGSLDGSTFTATNCTAVNGTTAVTTTTANGVWSCSVIGLNYMQVRFSAYGSGAATVSYQTAYVAGGSSSGGGAAGNVSIIQGGNTAAVNASSQLSVNCANCSGSGVSQQDNTGFTPGTTNFVPVGGEVDDVATSAVAENSAGSARITPQRGLHVNLRTLAGAETGIAALPFQVSLANTAANATAVKVDGSAVTQPVSGTFFQATQPISAVTLPLPTGASTLAEQQTQTTALQLIDNIVSGAGVNITQFGGTNVVTGTGASGAGIPRVTISSDSSLAANQSVNEAQINGVAVTMGNGIAGTGVQRVAIASDNTAFSVNANAGTGTFTTSEAAPATLLNGQTSVTTAGTRVVLAGSTTAKGVTVCAKSTNTGNIFMGSSTVTSANGRILRPGECQSVAIANLNTVNIDSAVNGEGVSYIGVN